MREASSGESDTRKRSASGMSAGHQCSADDDCFVPNSESEVQLKAADPLLKANEGSCKAKPNRPEGVTPCPRCDSNNTKVTPDAAPIVLAIFMSLGLVSVMCLLLDVYAT